MEQSGVSKKNSEFWDELCGSQLANMLGIKDDSPEALKKFDDWYFNFYPYLANYIPFSELNGMDVLEVGLGYGTVAQRLVEAGCNYQGLDIAKGPVDMVNHRVTQVGLTGKATQGSILEPPFENESFDVIVAIGCLHHTGNLALAIEQCRQLLRSNGKLIFMVYYANSYRRLHMSPVATLENMLKELFGYRGVVDGNKSNDRAAYDINESGEGAPHTDWISKRSLKYLCKDFSSFLCATENIDQESPFSRKTRDELLKTVWPSLMGLDLYAIATK